MNLCEDPRQPSICGQKKNPQPFEAEGFSERIWSRISDTFILYDNPPEC